MDEIALKDEIIEDFVIDEKLSGEWETFDLINKIEGFNINGGKDDLFIKKLLISSTGEVIALTNKRTLTSSYTKGYIKNFCSPDTMSKYIYKDIDNETYLIVEWKSGDYAFGHLLRCYYVFKKIN